MGDAFSDAATPLNWQCDDHPAYKCEDLPEGLSAFVRNRYKHWAPKVMWVVRLWASLGTLDSLFRMQWLTRTRENTEADVRNDRKDKGRQVFFAGTPRPARM